jgi:hypothetical protein
VPLYVILSEKTTQVRMLLRLRGIHFESKNFTMVQIVCHIEPVVDLVTECPMVVRSNRSHFEILTRSQRTNLLKES